MTPSNEGSALTRIVLDRVARMGNQLPPRLKSLLNLGITAALVLLAIPYVWRGIDGRIWSELSLGLGLLLLGIFNLFT